MGGIFSSGRREDSLAARGSKIFNADYFLRESRQFAPQNPTKFSATFCRLKKSWAAIKSAGSFQQCTLSTNTMTSRVFIKMHRRSP